MYIDSYGGILIREYYQYYYYDNHTETTGFTSGYTDTDLYIVPHININDEIDVPLYDKTITLLITGMTFNEWFIDYANKLSDNSYLNELGQNIEERYIFDEYMEQLYKVEHTFDSSYADNSDAYAIYDYSTNNLWENSGNTFFELEVDECGNYTGNRIVYTINSNRFSKKSYEILRKYMLNRNINIQTKINSYSNITNNSVDLNLTLESEITIDDIGVCYSTFSTPTVEDIIYGGLDSGTYSVTIPNLISNTTYYFRAYITYNDKVIYGNEITIKTL